jgi:hypothetical protein
MKKLFFQLSFILFALGSLFSACKKTCTNDEIQQLQQVRARYSTISEFDQGIRQVISMATQRNVKAYLDTLPNGYPNVQGRTMLLSNFAYSIIEKLEGNQVVSAVYDVFHFDGATFSLVSYIRKAQMVGDISAQTMVEMIASIPLPPIPVDGFSPPTETVATTTTGDCCKDNICNPKLSILVTWVHVAPCGNFAKGKSGFAAGDKFTGMPTGQSYRFNAVISGCPCPGTLTHTVTTPAGASYGEASGKDGSVDILPVTPGTYTITFTYTVCGTTITKTFTLGVG